MAPVVISLDAVRREEAVITPFLGEFLVDEPRRAFQAGGLEHTRLPVTPDRLGRHGRIQLGQRLADGGPVLCANRHPHAPLAGGRVLAVRRQRGEHRCGAGKMPPRMQEGDAAIDEAALVRIEFELRPELGPALRGERKIGGGQPREPVNYQRPVTRRVLPAGRVG
jgi:hypothetical protein